LCAYAFKWLMLIQESDSKCKYLNRSHDPCVCARHWMEKITLTLIRMEGKRLFKWVMVIVDTVIGQSEPVHSIFFFYYCDCTVGSIC